MIFSDLTVLSGQCHNLTLKYFCHPQNCMLISTNSLFPSLAEATLLVKEDIEKAGLKFNIQKTKITASDPITSSQIDGETMETMTDFIFLGSKITVDGDCGHEIKRHLFFGMKAMTNLDSILKSREITLLTKVCVVKAMVFPVVTHGCES